MNMTKTFMLLAALTALFMALGAMFAGKAGALIALVIAGGMNFYAYWNSDKMVLRMHDAIADLQLHIGFLSGITR